MPAQDIKAMGRHLPQIQREEAELLANLITQRLMTAAVDLLVSAGYLRKSELADDPEASPEENAEIRRAGRVLSDFLRRR